MCSNSFWLDFCFKARSQASLGWPASHYVAHVGLELTVIKPHLNSSELSLLSAGNTNLRNCIWAQFFFLFMVIDIWLCLPSSFFYKWLIFIIYKYVCVCGGHRSYISWSCSYRRFDQHLVDVENWNCSPGEGSFDPFLIVKPSLQTHLSFSQRSTSFYLCVGLCICVWVYTCEYRCPKSWEEDIRPLGL